MNKKVIYLLLALVLPGLIFIFLKIFGKNYVDISVYYSDGISDFPKECAGAFKGQYTLPDSVLLALGSTGKAAYLFVDSSAIDNKDVAQLKQSFGGRQLQVISLEGL